MQNELYHHGIMGQRWGIRRYQNPDGSLTNAGKLRYGRAYQKQIDKYRALSDARSIVKDFYSDKLQKRAVRNAKNKAQDKLIKDKTRIEDIMNRKTAALDRKITKAANKAQQLMDIIGENNMADVMDYVNDNKSFYESANDYIYGRVYY